MFRLKKLVELAGMGAESDQVVYDRILTAIVDLMVSPFAYLYFYDEESELFTLHAWSESVHSACRVVAPQTRYSLRETGLWGEVVRQRRPIIDNDYRSPHPAKKGCPPGHVPLARFLGVPVFAGTKIVAVAGVANKADPYTEADALNLQEFTQACWSLILQRIEQRQAIEERERFVRLFEEMPNACTLREIICDAEGRPCDYLFLEVNAQYAAISGKTRAEIQGKRGREIFTDIEPFWIERYGEVALKQTVDEFEHYSTSLGRHLSVRVYSPEPRRFVTIATDITERKRLKGELVSALEAARLAERTKSNFLANMSHEIRTPLNGLLGMLEILKELNPSPEQAEYIQDASKSGWALLRLLNEILDISKMDAQRMVLNSRPVDLSELEASVRNTFTPLLKNRAVALRIDCAPAVPPVFCGDEVRIRQILFNLVGNAIKFTEQGQVSLTTALGVAAAPDRLRLRFVVADSGVGIPEEKLDSIFEPFVQVDSSYQKRFQGSGLGLAIVSRLVELMNGTIKVRSTPGEGTTVEVEIDVEPMHQEVCAELLPEQVEGRDPGGLNVLLVEDNEINRKLVTRMMTRRGHRVTAAVNGYEALVALAANPFSLVLMDIQMPVLDGVEAFRMLRSGEAGGMNATTPVVALTAYALDEERERLQAVGMDGYIEKPFSWEKIDQVLGRLFTG